MEDLVQVLTKFHREVMAPDIERIVGEAEQRLRNEMHTLFDALSQQIQELRTEYHMKARVDGLQEQVRTIEARLDD